ncbi:MAG: 4-oxalocrotonate tautomerase [Clostridia bacterium]|nr:4-oxalocrotonate tautomerase [Clostridia bacterium]
MPTIRIDLIEGRNLEQKRELVKGITEVVLRTCNTRPERVVIYINEIPVEHAARGGILRCDEEKPSSN